MINRDMLRARKQQECDNAIRELYDRIPQLQELEQQIGQKNIAMIRAGVLQKNTALRQQLQQEIDWLQDQRHGLLARYGLDESIYEPKWDCPICQDRGYTAPGVLCSCYLKERMEALFSNSGMPQTMQQQTFETFDLSLYEDGQKISRCVSWCKAFASQVIQGTCRENLFLTGQVGRGKTHLAAAIANRVLDGGRHVLYRRASDLFDVIRAHRFADDRTMYHQLMEQLYSCDLLVLDDLGAENTTEFVMEQLVVLLEERDMHNKPWVITSNLRINEISSAYNDRVSDRILNRGVIFHLERSTSIRQERALQRMGQIAE